MTTRLKINKKMGIVWILMFTVLLFVSQISRAQGNFKRHFDKPKFRVSIHNDSHRTCYILYKKRTSVLKHQVPVYARRYKFKPMAETDRPGMITMRSLSRQ